MSTYIRIVVSGVKYQLSVTRGCFITVQTIVLFASDEQTSYTPSQNGLFTRDRRAGLLMSHTRTLLVQT